MRLTVSFLLFFVLCCTPPRDWETLKMPRETAWDKRFLPPSDQYAGGNARAGWEYLIYGDYIGSGVPVAAMGKRMPPAEPNTLPREGLAKDVYFAYNVFQTGAGVPVISGNCLTCHAGRLNGEWVFGLGNTESEFQTSLKVPAWAVNRLVNKKFKPGTPEREAFGHFGDYYRAIAPYVQTAHPNTSPAFRLEEACVRYRNPSDLRYRDEPNFEMLEYTLASDVPPLWNLDKKNALYYNGMGRGDFRKLLMQACVLGTADSASARQSLAPFGDVLAWAQALQPPPYPFPIEAPLAAQGKVLFSRHCESCHGRYGDAAEYYPNLIVSLDAVGTDPLYALYFTQRSGLAPWYNQSWFAHSEPASRLEPADGYVAPPLDGIWATAPYLHNGSVPTLDDLLNSPLRPRYWRRVGGSTGYDLAKGGWKYERMKKARGKKTYDTTLPGYGNQGHTFGDRLNEAERKALIEYLKTL